MEEDEYGMKMKEVIPNVGCQSHEPQKVQSNEIAFPTEDLESGNNEAYLGVETIAKLLVTNTIHEANCEIEETTGIKVDGLTKKQEPTYNNIDWPTISMFNKELGSIKINEFIDLWVRTEDWMHCIDFIGVESDLCSFYYFYEVKWSIPTNDYPIPHAVASVYFTIEVSKIKPPIYPVEVTYVFEYSQFIHIPGKINFQEKFLFDIINSKIKLFKSVSF